MSTVHQLIGVAEPGGLLFECESCGRRLVIDRDTGEMVIVDHGDRAALHRGSIGDISLSVPEVHRS
ncbi:hypothetical protein OHA21_09520 [Actinoplanes sp. NBC_00393]|uniref:hypothetical protein n=1 Tax=Actinoplanes sp. NBC_00393 TaxID=2975953 RepID=UPI002E1F50F0